MKKLFYLLLALPLVFAACEPDTPEQKTEYEAVLTLTSEATMNFEAAGGEGTITYTAEMREVTRVSEPAKVEAACEAEWVNDLTVAENITFTVAANEGDKRETKVVVTYGDKKFEVAVKQAAKESGEEPEPEPEPDQPVEFSAWDLTGSYYGDEYSPGVGNYYIYLSDMGFSEDGSAYAGGTYYRLDLYGPMFEGTGDITIPVGTYSFDANDTCAEWTIGNYYSSMIAFDEAGNLTTAENGDPYTAAELVVTESGMTLTATINGVEHIVTFSGKGNIVDERTAPSEDINFTANYAYAIYFGDQYNPDTSDNYYFFLSDVGLDENGYERFPGTFYRFDIFAETVNKADGLALPNGRYTIDYSNTMNPGTFTYEYSGYYVWDSNYMYEDVQYFTEGTLEVTDNNIVATLLIDGNTHIVTFEGKATIYDQSPDDGGSGGGDEGDEGGEDDGGDDPVNPGDSYSTLTGDLELNINASYALEYYGDYYSATTDNWVLYLYEDAETYTGAYVMLDFLNDPYADNIAGTYTPDNGSYKQYTYFAGYVDDGDMWGVWYVDMVEGEPVGLAPLTDGEIKIEWADGDVYTVTLDCVDDAGHKVTGVIVAEPIDYTRAISKSKPAKKSTATIEKQRLEVMPRSAKSTISVR